MLHKRNFLVARIAKTTLAFPLEEIETTVSAESVLKLPMDEPYLDGFFFYKNKTITVIGRGAFHSSWDHTETTGTSRIVILKNDYAIMTDDLIGVQEIEAEELNVGTSIPFTEAAGILFSNLEAYLSQGIFPKVSDHKNILVTEINHQAMAIDVQDLKQVRFINKSELTKTGNNSYNHPTFPGITIFTTDVEPLFQGNLLLFSNFGLFLPSTELNSISENMIEKAVTFSHEGASPHSWSTLLACTEKSRTLPLLNPTLCLNASERSSAFPISDAA